MKKRWEGGREGQEKRGGKRRGSRREEKREREGGGRKREATSAAKCSALCKSCAWIHFTTAVYGRVCEGVCVRVCEVGVRVCPWCVCVCEGVHTPYRAARALE